ncbi:MAG: hypothetical protein GJ678_07790 [Rhodobacteraceae bacterium]|nr:hypothetical protein [Paracoccaceae bacterium]
MPKALTRPVLIAATLYFAGVFACGFVLGTIRILILLPRMEEIWALLLELPVILTLSWLIAGRIPKARPSLATLYARLGTGGWAFLLLMLVEYLLATTAMGLSGAEFFARWTTLEGALGLAGQILFVLLPALRLLTEPRHSGQL